MSATISAALDSRTKIAKLKQQIQETNNGIDNLTSQREAINASIEKRKKALKKLEDQLAKFDNVEDEIAITDHARVRFVERVVGYDIDKAIRGYMEDSRLLEKVNLLKSGKFPINHPNTKFVIQNRKLVTVIEEK